MKMSRFSSKPRATVSPLGQAILSRSNTEAVFNQIESVAAKASEIDKRRLVENDQKPSLLHSATGILKLFLQLKVLLMAVYHAILCAFAFRNPDAPLFQSQIRYVEILGWICGLLIAFRQREGMTRWWEGRKQWGSVTSASRDLVRCIISYNHEKTTSMRFATFAISLSIVMKNYLRDMQHLDEEELRPLLTEEDLTFLLGFCHQDRVVTVFDLLSGTLLRMVNGGTISMETVHLLIEPKISLLNDCFGSCHRIKTTPLPDMYRVFLDLVIFLFLVIFPISLLNQGWNSIAVLIVSTMLSAVLNGLAKLAAQMEDPFNNDPNDLPLGRFCRIVVDQNLKIADRWFRPGSMLHAQKTEQTRQHELDKKIRRAQIKAMVVSAFSPSSPTDHFSRRSKVRPDEKEIEELVSSNASSRNLFAGGIVHVDELEENNEDLARLVKSRSAPKEINNTQN